MCRWVLSRLSGSSVSAFRVVPIRLVQPDTPWGSLGSFEFVWFVLVRLALVVARFVRFPLIPSGALCRSLVFFWFVRVGPGGLWLRSGVSVSFGCATGVAGFVRVRLVRSRAPWGSLGSSGFLYSIWVRSGGRCVLSGSFGACGWALEVVGFVKVRLVCSGAPWCFFGLVWFVRVHLVCPGGGGGGGGGAACRWVLLCSSCSSRCTIGVARFIWISLVRQNAPWGSLVSFTFIWFVRVGPGCSLGFILFVRGHTEGR